VTHADSVEGLVSGDALGGARACCRDQLGRATGPPLGYQPQERSAGTAGAADVLMEMGSVPSGPDGCAGPQQAGGGDCLTSTAVL
jgi:hypothetical protein